MQRRRFENLAALTTGVATAHTAVVRHARSLVLVSYVLNARCFQSAMLWLCSSCSLRIGCSVKTAGPGIFAISPWSPLWVGWANVAPESPSLAGETHRGAFGQRILVWVGLCSRGVGATISHRRSTCVERMAER